MGLKKDDLCKIANKLGIKVAQADITSDIITKITNKVNAAPGCVKKSTTKKTSDTTVGATKTAKIVGATKPRKLTFLFFI